MGRIWLLLLVSACFRPSYAHTACGPADECPGALVCVQGFCELAGDGGAGEVDAGVDGPTAIDGAILDGAADGPPDAQSCYGVGLVRVCFTTPPVGHLSLPLGGPLDTTASANCSLVVGQQAGPQLCVIAGATVTVSGAQVVVGARPLVLIATDTLTVSSSGTLDLSSASGTGARIGAGGNAVECSRSDKGTNDTGGGGGGGGGSFGTSGGRGGTGDLNDSPGGRGTGGNPGAAQPSPTVLHGGCSGGPGGNGSSTDPRSAGGPAGDGGGAVYLIAGNRAVIDGDVFASGAGGGVTQGSTGQEEGGGGGGSGGMIVLDAPMIQIAGRVVANGGAGGGGGGNVGGTAGGNGSTQLWNQRAPGGVGDPVPPPTGPAGNGAEGTAAGLITNIDGGSSDLGAGGGAGGLGLIWTYGTLNGGAMTSPAPIQH